MRVKVYLRVAKPPGSGRPIVLANAAPSYEPVIREGTHLPTAAFALEIDIPDERFHLAEQVLAEIKMVEENTEIATDIVYP